MSPILISKNSRRTGGRFDLLCFKHGGNMALLPILVLTRIFQHLLHPAGIFTWKRRVNGDPKQLILISIPAIGKKVDIADNAAVHFRDPRGLWISRQKVLSLTIGRKVFLSEISEFTMISAPPCAQKKPLNVLGLRVSNRDVH